MVKNSDAQYILSEKAFMHTQDKSYCDIYVSKHLVDRSQIESMSKVERLHDTIHSGQFGVILTKNMRPFCPL